MIQWTDNAIVLKVRKLGEYDGIVTVLSKQHGKCNGVVKGGYSKRLRPLLEQGNVIHIHFKSRTEDQLGLFSVEGDFNPSVNILTHSGKLTALGCGCAIIEKSVAFDQHIEDMYEVFKSLLIALDSKHWVDSYCRWEFVLLSELGTRLDFSKCASTNSKKIAN